MYTQWFETVLARRQRYEPWRFVLISQTLAWTSYLFICGYLTLSGEVSGTWLYVAGLGLTGMVLVGLSYLLSSVCYLWARLATKVLYRSYVGKAGYLMLIAYGVLTLFGSPQIRPFPQYFFQDGQFYSTMLAVLAMALLTLVMMASYGRPIHHIGSVGSRRVMRLGYVAIGLGIWMLVRLGWSTWTAWFAGAFLVPPISLIIWIFLIWVLMMRLVLAYRLKG